MDKQRPLQQPALIKLLRDYQSGFSLIEVLIVFIIIGILSAAYISFRLPGNGAGIRVNAAANQLATDIRLAQSLAMSINQRRQVNFSANAYSVTDTSNNPAWLNSGNIAFNPLISITSATPSSIQFNGRGIPYLNNSIALTTSLQVVLKASTGEQRTVTVAPDTGAVGVANP